jgi:hypothetical protein
MKRLYAEQRGVSGTIQHNKMIELIDDGSRVIYRWGSIGCKKPSEKVICESSSVAEREAAWRNKYAEKCQRKSHPYSVVEINGNAVKNRASTEGRRWGLEVETHSSLPIQDIVAKMRKRGLEVNVDTGRYFKSSGRIWDCKRDGSCGYEFASPILSGEAGLFDAKLAVDKIREVCPTAVNEKCGIHVTIDVSDHSPDQVRNLIIAYLYFQEGFYEKCASWRQNNRYCQRNPGMDLGHAIDYIKAQPSPLTAKYLDNVILWAGGNSRYHGLNLTRYKEKKIIEFRMLESSVNVRKVGDWIQTCVGFVDKIFSLKNINWNEIKRLSLNDLLCPQKN